MTTPAQTPGSGVVSKSTGSTPSPNDASIHHSYHNIHLHLPVMASSQTLSTQHLLLFIKPIWVIRMRMVLLHHLHPPVVLRQREGSVSCVWVQCEITGIYRTEERGWIRTVCGCNQVQSVQLTLQWMNRYTCLHFHLVSEWEVVSVKCRVWVLAEKFRM